jgi:hypothetical protein
MLDADLPSLRVAQSHIAIGKPNLGGHCHASIQHGEDSSIAFVSIDDLSSFTWLNDDATIRQLLQATTWT